MENSYYSCSNSSVTIQAEDSKYLRKTSDSSHNASIVLELRSRTPSEHSQSNLAVLKSTEDLKSPALSDNSRNNEPITKASDNLRSRTPSVQSQNNLPVIEPTQDVRPRTPPEYSQINLLETNQTEKDLRPRTPSIQSEINSSVTEPTNDTRPRSPSIQSKINSPSTKTVEDSTTPRSSFSKSNFCTRSNDIPKQVNSETHQDESKPSEKKSATPRKHLNYLNKTSCEISKANLLSVQLSVSDYEYIRIFSREIHKHFRNIIKKRRLYDVQIADLPLPSLTSKPSQKPCTVSPRRKPTTLKSATKALPSRTQLNQEEPIFQQKTPRFIGHRKPLSEKSRRSADDARRLTELRRAYTPSHTLAKC